MPTFPSVCDIWTATAGAPVALRLAAVPCRVVPASSKFSLTAGLTVAPYTHRILFESPFNGGVGHLRDSRSQFQIPFSNAPVPFDWASDPDADWLLVHNVNQAGQTVVEYQLITYDWAFLDELSVYIEAYCNFRNRG